MRAVIAAGALVASACGRSDDRAAPPAPIATPAPAMDEHALALAACPAVRAPYLFRVETHERASYLFGTRHRGVGLARLPAVVTDRLAHATQAVLEAAPAAAGATPSLDAELDRFARGAGVPVTTLDPAGDRDAVDPATYCDGARLDLPSAGVDRAWLPELERRFDAGDAFVAIGVEHLVGEDGLLAALARDGYQVTREP